MLDKNGKWSHDKAHPIIAIHCYAFPDNCDSLKSHQHLTVLCVDDYAYRPVVLWGAYSSRGTPSPNKIHDGMRFKCLSIIHEKYLDFAPTLAHEKLVEYHNISVSLETLRQWMCAGQRPCRAQYKSQLEVKPLRVANLVE